MDEVAASNRGAVEERAGGGAGRILVDCGEPPSPAEGHVEKGGTTAPLSGAADGAGAILPDDEAGGDAAPDASPPALPVPSAEAPPPAPPYPVAEDHYQLLGLPPRASREQIERAYRFCRDLYGPSSLATYSLLEPDEVEDARARIDEAYDVLTDPGKRRQYDEARGLLGPDADPAWYRPREPAGHGPEPVALPDVVDGAALKRIREARGISLREIAAASKVGVRYLEYIEQDRLAFLPAPVYLRGFLQEYARMVGLDPRRVAEGYLARITTDHSRGRSGSSS